MRRARFTFIGAFHHVMNRGHNGNAIFPNPEDKKYFLNILHTRALLNKIKIFAYCIMDNHYHIILQNISGKLSDFMKQVNSIYATYFRRKYGGQGYVFQNRFKSTLIQDERYLLTSIIYTLLNPVRANIVKSAFEYRWSSITEYFNNRYAYNVTDIRFVEELLQSKENLIELTGSDVMIEEKNTRLGKVIGDERFIDEAKRRFDRRKRIEEKSCRSRVADIGFKPAEKVIKDFEEKEKFKIEKINTHIRSGKKLRLKLLIRLREESGLRYSQINKIIIFQDLKLYSLSVLYNRGIKNRVR